MLAAGLECQRRRRGLRLGARSDCRSRPRTGARDLRRRRRSQPGGDPRGLSGHRADPGLRPGPRSRTHSQIAQGGAAASTSTWPICMASWWARSTSISLVSRARQRDRLYSPTGGVGVSTTAVNLAATLAASNRGQVALAELKPHLATWRRCSTRSGTARRCVPAVASPGQATADRRRDRTRGRHASTRPRRLSGRRQPPRKHADPQIVRQIILLLADLPHLGARPRPPLG